jgi:hypothetical protein
MTKLQAIRIDRTVQGDREIQLPFRCFACHDGGLAGGRFLSKFVEGESDIPFICNCDECDAGRIRRTAYGANSDPNYRNAFDSRLDRYACEDIHNWEKQSYIDDLVKRRSRQVEQTPVADQFSQKVEDRDRRILEIQQAIAEAESQGANLSTKIQKTVQMCSDRDGVTYQDWKFLPSGDHQRMLNGIKQLQGAAA